MMWRRPLAIWWGIISSILLINANKKKNFENRQEISSTSTILNTSTIRGSLKDLQSSVIQRIDGNFIDIKALGRILHPLVRQSLLPRVYILPISKKYNVECFVNETLHAMHSNQLHLDVMFHKWLKYSYPLTVKENSTADLFLLPIYTKLCNFHVLDGNETFWGEVNDLIWSYVMEPSFTSYALDLTFMSALYPTKYPYNHPKTMQPTTRLRSLYDIRLLRYDNYQTINVRDVFVPYGFSKVPKIYSKQEAGVLNREKPFFCQCRADLATKGKGSYWHDKACSILKRLCGYRPYAQEEMNHDRAMARSDFCFVVPDHTPSSPHLFRSILSGCIPVFFASFKEQLPFSKFLDWSRFSIVVMKDMVFYDRKMDGLMAYLNSILKTPELLMKYKRNLAAVAPLFDYQRVEWPSVYHLTLLDLKTSSGCGTRMVQDFSPFDDSRTFLFDSKASKKQQADDLALMDFIC